MDKRNFAALALFGFAAAALSAQVNIAQDAVAAYALGFAAADQAISSGEAGAYGYERNGYSLAGNVQLKASLEPGYDIVVKLAARGRTGSPYLELQLPPSSAATGSLSLDSVYGRINVWGERKLAFPVELYLWAGKYSVAASNPAKLSRWGTEAALGMLKLPSVPNAGLEMVKVSTDPDQISDFGFATLNVQAHSGGAYDQALPRLYDTDGSMSAHGKAMIGEYAPQLYASARLTNYVLPFAYLSAEAVYTLNGAGIYSGNSFGLAAQFNIPLKSPVLFLPVGLDFGFYEKNVDILSGSIGTALADNTTDFRASWKAGLAAGLRYTVLFQTAAEITLAGSWSHIGHIYRDPIDLFGCSLDAKYTLGDFFVGAGALAGTLADVTWKTKAGVSTMFDDYARTFKPLENYGLEAYGGLNLGEKASIVVGVNKNRGLALGYAIEAVKDGQMKYRQSGSAASDGRYETFAFYLKTTVKM
jgi:hypothetical protein